MSRGSRPRSNARSGGSPAAPQIVPPRRSESKGPPPPVRRKLRSWPLAPIIVERGNIDGIETFADPEQEDADDDESDQDRERDADLDHQRHALGAGRRQHQSILERHEPHDLTD